MSNISPWDWGYWPYYNPYVQDPVVVGNTTINYSQPIVLAGPPGDSTARPDAGLPLAGGSAAGFDAVQQSDAVAQLDAARAAVADGDYAKALAQCDKAIAQQPNDVVLHEFRGLALFALHRYKEAAGTIYAVLSIGPGWDWTTLSGFYPDVNIYTQQHLHPATSRWSSMSTRTQTRPM